MGRLCVQRAKERFGALHSWSEAPGTKRRIEKERSLVLRRLRSQGCPERGVVDPLGFKDFDAVGMEFLDLSKGACIAEGKALTHYRE